MESGGDGRGWQSGLRKCQIFLFNRKIRGDLFKDLVADQVRTPDIGNGKIGAVLLTDCDNGVGQVAADVGMPDQLGPLRPVDVDLAGQGAVYQQVIANPSQAQAVHPVHLHQLFRAGVPAQLFPVVHNSPAEHRPDAI